MQIWIKVLRGFGYIWIALAGIVVAVGLFGIWTQGGFSALSEVLSPFNVTNWIVTAITFAPGVAALIWADKLRDKMAQRAL